MASAQTSPAKSAKKKLGVFETKKFTVTEEFVHLTPERVQGTMALCDKNVFEPTKKERKMIKDAFMQHMDEFLPEDQLIVRIGTNRLVMKKSTETEEFEKLAKDVFVFSYIGKGTPKEPDHSDYKRIPLKQPNNYDLNYRWTKVIVDPPEFRDKEPDFRLSKALAQIPSYLEDDYVGVHIKMSFHRIEGRLQDLVSEVYDAADSTRRNFWNEAINTLVANETDSIPTPASETFVALHGHKSYKAEPDRVSSIKGLDFVHGTACKLYITGHDTRPLALLEQGCASFFFPNITVAEFLTDYLSTANSLTGIKEAMRGLKVRIKTADGHDDRHIHKLDDRPEAVTDARKHSTWLAKPDRKIELADLPCVNVGSAQKHKLIPAEMCKILPMQSVGKQAGLLLHLEAIRKQHVGMEQQARAKKVAIGEAERKVKAAEGRKKFDAAFADARPKILFIEAGTTKRLPKGWMELCKKVSDNAREKSDDEDSEGSESETNDSPYPSPTLSLRYTPGNDPSATWKEQLQKFIAKRSTEHEKVLLVVAVGSGQHHKTIYQTLKQLCDSEEVGKQTFFVNTNTLEQKQKKAPGSAMIRAANEISHRIRIRNPPSHISEHTDITIGLHVTHFTADTHKVDDEGNLRAETQEFLLVSTVSREVSKSQGYRTRRVLLTDDEVQRFDASKYVQDHLNDSGDGRVIILRSGYMPSVEVASASLTSAGIILPVAPSSDFGHALSTLGDASLARMEHAKAVQIAPSALNVPIQSRGALVNREIAQIQRAVNMSGMSASKCVSYILLEEEFAVETMPSAKGTSIEDSVKDLSLTSQAVGQVAVSTPETQLVPGLTSANGGEGSNKKRKMVSSNPSSNVVAMTFLGRDLADKPDPSSRRKSTTSGSSTGGNRTDYDPQDEILSALFRDTHLELYNTKMPILSYLAQAAAKRAMMHLTTSRKDMLQLPALPKIGAEVASSLYYL